MSTQKRNSLGRGLGALLGEETAAYAGPDGGRAPKTVPVEFLHPGGHQPRYVMDDAAIAELASSIRDRGVLQPLLVRPHPDHTGHTGHPDHPAHYEIVAGERRWRAAQKAQLHEVPVIIKEFTDSEALEVGLVENLQRQDLSVMEEALGYRRLLDEFRHTQENLAKAVGKSRSHVANTLRLLTLPRAVRDLIDDGSLSAGHARALVPCDDPVPLARQVVERGLSVRQTERLAKTGGTSANETSRKGKPARDPNTVALERDMSHLLGMRVEISSRATGGTLSIRYSDLDQLEDVLRRLSHAPTGPAPAATGTIPDNGPVPLDPADSGDSTNSANSINSDD